MVFEKASASQVVSFAPAGLPYTQSILAAGTQQSNNARGSSPWLVIPPLLSDATGYPSQPGDVFQLWTSGGILKEPTLFQVASVAPNSAHNAWNVYFNPLPAVTPVAGDQVISLSRPTRPIWLGAVGHVTALQYSYSCPGGPDAMSCTLQVPPEYRTEAMNPGRVIQVMRGGGCVWEGILDEPVPSSTGWSIAAYGAGTAGTNFADIWTTWNNPDDHVNEAIARGLRWKNPGIGNPAGIYLSQQQNSGSESITDFMNLITTGGSLLWDVQEGQSSSLPAGPPQLRVYQYPTDSSGNPNGTPTRLLLCTTPVARTITADINTIVGYYQETPDIPATAVTPAIAGTFTTTIVQNAGAARQHGVLEYYLDLSSGGVFTEVQAQSICKNVLSRYVRANFAGPFTVGPGQYMNPGGAPVDLGCEHAGEIAQLIVTDGSYGGEVGPGPITFLVGEYAFDNDTDSATITPFAGVRTDMASLVSALYPVNFGGPAAAG